MTLNDFQAKLCEENPHDFNGLRAVFVNCSLKARPGDSHTRLLLGVSADMMQRAGVTVDHIHMQAHQVPPGVYPDMTEHGARRDDWPKLWNTIEAANILVVVEGTGPSTCTRFRLARRVTFDRFRSVRPRFV